MGATAKAASVGCRLSFLSCGRGFSPATTESAVSKGLIEVRCGGERYAINPDQVRYISQDSVGTSFVSFGEKHGLTLGIGYTELVARLNDWTQHEPDISPAVLVPAE